MNRVFAVGKIVSKPELRKAGASDVLKFRIECSEMGFNGKEFKTFLSVQQWGKQAAASAALHNEGDVVVISGSLKTDTYEKQGQKQFMTVVNAQSVDRVGSSGGGYQHTPQRSRAVEQDQDEDIPF